MLRLILLAILLVTVSAQATNRSPAAASKPIAFFAPHEGPQAYEYLFELISNAQKSVHMSIYSWRDQKGLEESLNQALENGAQVKIVLHPSLAKNSRMENIVTKLELKGAILKKSFQNMHEKFAIIDGKYLLNTSANMSPGPLTHYSENFIFHSYSTYPAAPFNFLIDEFENEFALLWNSSSDIITHNEEIAPPIEINTKLEYSPYAKLYSSSANWIFTKNERRTTTQKKKYEQGQYLSYKRNGGSERNQSWIIRDQIIKEIDKAKTSIYMAINHFNITEISDALIRAVKRGIDVRLAVDNQEFALSSQWTIARTPLFVEEWKKIKSEPAPVRIKFYSLRPSYMFWFLNHHKFMLIDYEAQPTLISGSYNISRNAEHKQFDNIVVYKSSRYKELYSSFYQEFNNLWNYNAIEKEELITKMLRPFRGAYRLHLKKNAISISWEEAEKLFNKIKKMAPGMWDGIERHDHCGYYHPKKNLFLNYANNGLVPCN